MDFIDELRALSSRISKQMEIIQTEEATKTAFVLPFITSLGYNVFDPTDVTPELGADIGVKKGEKVDYAILRDGKPVMLFECKSCKTNLDSENITQLYRYFAATEARFGILTNGILYRFFTDLEEANKMDKKPFLEFSLLDIKDSVVEDLKRFSKANFDLEGSLTAASELKYTKEIKQILSEQLISPSEDFIKLFASKVYSGNVTQAVKQQFADLTKRAINQFINERITDRLKSAMSEEAPTAQVENSPVKEESGEPGVKVTTTPEEMEGFYIVKSILRQCVDVNRIFMRDTASYFGILFDDNNRKPICRLYFNNTNKKYFGLFGSEKKEEKVPIEQLNDIYKYADQLCKIVQQYESIAK